MHCCKECNVGFDKPTAYLNHRKRHHPKFLCPDCGKAFGVKKKLAYHLRGCGETRKNKARESGSIISFSNYKRLPIVTAQELDIEFEIYMNRKFGKKGIFRNEKMCKFCCKTFVMASDFADHIRNHYKSIPLDATSVKSKFDFMQFMGLKIRETNDTDCSDMETANKLKNKMVECRVVIVGERCKICCQSFKCRTDLDQHNKIHHHSVKKRNEITLVLKIGEEIISRIPLRKRHIRRSARRGYQSNCKRLRIRLHEMYDTLKHSSNVKEKDKRKVGESNLNCETYDFNKDLQVIGGVKNLELAMHSDKKRRRALRLQSGINQTEGTARLCSQEVRGKEEFAGQEVLDTGKEAGNGFDFEKSNYEMKMRGFELETGRIYADEFFESMQFSEPWKDEFSKGDGSWYSETKLEENDLASDQESCYCIGTIGPRLTPKEDRNTWEQEHFNNSLNNEEESGSCHEMSLHVSPPIYKYSCDSKYQADFSFPSDEKSYGFEVKNLYNVETNNNEKDTNHNANESCIFDYKGALIVKNEGTNLAVNHSRSGIYQCEDKSYNFRDSESGKAKYQEVLIKEEVMLDDCTCCINELYPSLSHLSG